MTQSGHLRRALASFLPATSLLYSRGAGFYYRHDGDARQQCPHRTGQDMGGGVRVVDTLAVRMVTDNIVIQFVPSEKRNGLTIERRGIGLHGLPCRLFKFAKQLAA